MLYKNLFQLYPDNFQNNYFLLSDKLEDIRYIVYMHIIMYSNGEKRLGMSGTQCKTLALDCSETVRQPWNSCAAKS